MEDSRHLRCCLQLNAQHWPRIIGTVVDVKTEHAAECVHGQRLSRGVVHSGTLLHCVAPSFAGSYDSGGECGVVTQKRFQMPLAPGPQMVRGEAVEMCTKLLHIPTHTHLATRTQNLAHVLTASRVGLSA